MNEDYFKGFKDGYKEGLREMGFLNKPLVSESEFRTIDKLIGSAGKRKRNVKQSPKQKLLTKMTKVKWDKYKKGRGKKTYVEIRGEVSRSQKYKKACKRL